MPAFDRITVPLTLTRFVLRASFFVVALIVATTRLDAQNGAPTDQSARAAQMHPRTGDRVLVKVFGEPTLSDAATVDELGRIMLPKLGMIQANSMSFAALRDT